MSNGFYKEGEDRYKKSLPPGFRDAKEKEDERKYGDFLLWKQILTFAQRESRPIIFVTGEKKEDWWIKKNGETVAPHIELRREFQKYVNQPFWMYRTQRFLEMAKEKLIVEIDPRSIKETNAIADVELIDEQDNAALKQAIEQIRIPDLILQQALEGIRTPDSELRKALQRIRTPDSELRKALQRIRTPDSELRKALQRIRTPDLTVQYAMQQAIEQMGFELKKALERIPPDFAVQQIPQQMQIAEEKGKEVKFKPKRVFVFKKA